MTQGGRNSFWTFVFFRGNVTFEPQNKWRNPGVRSSPTKNHGNYPILYILEQWNLQIFGNPSLRRRFNLNIWQIFLVDWLLIDLFGCFWHLQDPSKLRMSLHAFHCFHHIWVILETTIPETQMWYLKGFRWFFFNPILQFRCSFFSRSRQNQIEECFAEVERDQIKLQQSHSKYFPKSRTETVDLS